MDICVYTVVIMLGYYQFLGLATFCPLQRMDVCSYESMVMEEASFAKLFSKGFWRWRLMLTHQLRWSFANPSPEVFQMF